MLVSDAEATNNRCEKFMAPVSGACATAIGLDF